MFLAHIKSPSLVNFSKKISLSVPPRRRGSILHTGIRIEIYSAAKASSHQQVAGLIESDFSTAPSTGLNDFFATTHYTAASYLLRRVSLVAKPS